MSNDTTQVSCRSLGFTLSSDPLYIIVEFLSKGNLKDLLKDSRSKGGRVYGNLHGASQSLSSKDLMKFAKDVADGMAFIANHKVCLRRHLAALVEMNGELERSNQQRSMTLSLFTSLVSVTFQTYIHVRAL